MALRKPIPENREAGGATNSASPNSWEQAEHSKILEQRVDRLVTPHVQDIGRAGRCHRLLDLTKRNAPAPTNLRRPLQHQWRQTLHGTVLLSIRPEGLRLGRLSLGLLHRSKRRDTCIRLCKR